jgi:NifB/MoaA-like Fe-S oxidoreductase
VAVVSGTLFAPVLERTLASARTAAGLGAAQFAVLAVENRFFGGNVSVTGLLTGADLVPAIAALPAGTVVLVPDIVANADGLLLDDVPACELAARTGRDVRLVSCVAGGLLGGLEDAAATPHELKE